LSGASVWWHAEQEFFSWHIAQLLAVVASPPVLDAGPWIFFQFRSWFGGRVAAVISA